MKAKGFITALISFFIFISCNYENRKEQYNALVADLEQQTADSTKEKIPVGNFQQLLADSLAQPLRSASFNPDWDKKMIKTGTMRLEVKNFRNSSTRVHNTIRQLGGYIAQEEQSTSNERTETVITIKVPVDQFENMINQLPAEEDKVLERKITTEDVTGDIVDTQARLETKKQLRAKYLEFLKESKKMEDILQVQNSVNNVQQEIESAAGRVQSLSRQALFSTIHLTFYQPVAGYTAADADPSFLTRVGNAFKTGGSWIADLFVGMISVWPLLLLVSVIYFGWKRVRIKQPVNS
ncbi:MAG TPA: DUF4349 domain-containing protein [Ferruginibacter sp.]|nr:DUF4349 domain-containing protein [Ferruginibacter sp.]